MISLHTNLLPIRALFPPVSPRRGEVPLVKGVGEGREKSALIKGNTRRSIMYFPMSVINLRHGQEFEGKKIKV